MLLLETRRKSISKTLFLTFLVLFTFAIGTFVGKTFTENQNKIGSLAKPIKGSPTEVTSPRFPASLSDQELDPRIIEIMKKQKQEVLDECQKMIHSQGQH